MTKTLSSFFNFLSSGKHLFVIEKAEKLNAIHLGGITTTEIFSCKLNLIQSSILES
jgi:hypothetical protein